MSSLAENLRDLEEQLLQLATRASAAELELLLSDDFIEFGSSGRVFDKPAIIASLNEETRSLDYELRDFRVTSFTPELAQVTYRLQIRGSAASLRSSIWRYSAGRWQMQFHQGSRISR